jgi:hypothetical protein
MNRRQLRLPANHVGVEVISSVALLRGTCSSSARSLCSKALTYWSSRASASRQAPRPAPRPARAARVEDLDLERVAGLGSLDGDRTAQRVGAIPVEVGEHTGVRIRADLPVTDIPRPHDHGVAGIEDEQRLVARVPLVMDDFVREKMRPRRLEHLGHLDLRNSCG